MLKIDFEYHDSYCKNDKWNTQSCVCESLAKCIEWYGLDADPDCEYRILSIKEV